MEKLKKWNVYHDFSETSTWNHMKMSRKEVSAISSKNTESEIVYMHRQNLRDRRLYEVGGRVWRVKKWDVCLDCSEIPTWNHMKISRKEVSATCCKSQNLASCTCSVKICVTHECKNICVTHESNTSTWKHMKMSRNILFFFWNEHKWVQDTCWETHNLRSYMTTLHIGVTPSSKGRVEGGEWLK